MTEPEPTGYVDYWARVRREQIREEGQLRRVECPRCGALVGEVCHSALFYPNDRGHVARRVLSGLEPRTSALPVRRWWP